MGKELGGRESRVGCRGGRWKTGARGVEPSDKCGKEVVADVLVLAGLKPGLEDPGEEPSPGGIRRGSIRLGCA